MNRLYSTLVAGLVFVSGGCASFDREGHVFKQEPVAGEASYLIRGHGEEEPNVFYKYFDKATNRERNRNF